MQNETIYKLVTMLGDARTAETELRRENTILQDRFYAFSKANDDLMRRVADMEKQITEYETILKPIRPEDEERMRQWVPVEDGPVDREQNVGDLVNIDGECVRVIDDSEFRHFLLGDLRICYQVRGRTS